MRRKGVFSIKPFLLCLDDIGPSRHYRSSQQQTPGFKMDGDFKINSQIGAVVV